MVCEHLLDGLEITRPLQDVLAYNLDHLAFLAG